MLMSTSEVLRLNDMLKPQDKAGRLRGCLVCLRRPVIHLEGSCPSAEETAPSRTRKAGMLLPNLKDFLLKIYLMVMEIVSDLTVEGPPEVPVLLWST
ncbi:hypothetical protein TNCV_3530761 [Trichonephila clavipes]|uniref:Uncharacterized protein n=1 Tax=Trichonephila clavipes TaxID=2585209 RepID=A0A8X6VF03_TRICX|nr:hypothetical protein TNCV_3530761 [Trichonephila clavipes]